MFEGIKSGYESRLGRLAQKRAEANDPEKDRHGIMSDSLSSTYSSLGFAEYLLHGDVDKMRDWIKQSIPVTITLIKRFESGEPISPSFVTMLLYHDVYHALAAGHFDQAEELASLMGGRDKIEKGNNLPFDRAMGYVLKAFVLEDRESMQKRAEEFALMCQKKGNLSFTGYAEVFKGVLAGDREAVGAGFKQIAKDHRRSAKSTFKNTDSEFLCIWGIGLANLCTHRYGFSIEANPPFFPADLLISESARD